MQIGNLNKWTNIEDCKNLLLFSQLVSELLFDYSIPSNRISTLNCHYLVLDALSAIDGIENNGVPEGTLKPIMEELYYELEKDEIFPNQEPLNYFIKRQNGNKFQRVKPRDLNYVEAKNCVSAIEKVFFKDNDYYNKLKEEITVIVKNNKAENQTKLFRLTKSLLTELMNKGYSLKYIYMVMDRLFWHSSLNIDSNDVIDKFFAAFDYKEKKYNVIFKVNYRKMSSFINHLHDINFLEQIPNDLSSKIDKYFESLKSDERFLSYEIESLDPFSAAEGVILLIESIASVYRLFNHNYRYDFQTADYRVVDDKESYKKGKTIKAVEHIKMPKESQIIENMNISTKALFEVAKGGNYADFGNVLNAVRYHAHSLDSRAEENQLLDLWSIFEAVLDISNKHSSDRINQICSYLIPILKHKYIYSLFSQLAKDIKAYDSVWYNDYVKENSEEKQIQIIAEFALLNDHQNDREKFYNKCESFPLLIERIKYYNETLNNKNNVYMYVEKHADRVEWQIMRIYRNRNLIIHNANKMPYLKLLIENLHSYVDVFLNYVFQAFSKNKDISSMCQELFIKECKWNSSFCNKKEELASEDIEMMLSM